LQVQPTEHEHAKGCKKQLPRDCALNESILERMVAANTVRVVEMCDTIFVKDLLLRVLHRNEGAIISKVVVRCKDAEYRTWLKTMTGLYPVSAYLHRIGKAISDICPHFMQG
jgi:hypothetical protein